jgi:DNA (cytosine-5)-methyltransferase 1
MAHKLTAIDLYCGSGAVTLGLKQVGFSVVGAVDIDPMACATYRANHPEVDLCDWDIRDVEPERFVRTLQGNLDLLVVCAPCQPFSSQNRKRSGNDLRRNLVLESQKFVKALKPKVLFLENVPGLKASDIFQTYREWLEGQGYDVSEPMKIDAADLGVPQRRTRMVLIATLGVDLNQACEIKKSPRRTVREALRGLSVPPVGSGSGRKDPLHFTRKHSELNLERLRHIPKDGGSRCALPERLQLDCHKNSRKGSFTDTYGRMAWDRVAPTLTTGCTDITRGRYAHPEQDRAITLREAARLQSFPDDYIFTGNAAQIARQIGNAVPPEMMRCIGLGLKSALLTGK